MVKQERRDYVINGCDKQSMCCAQDDVTSVSEPSFHHLTFKVHRIDSRMWPNSWSLIEIVIY